jgi:hypothetical protein
MKEGIALAAKLIDSGKATQRTAWLCGFAGVVYTLNSQEAHRRVLSASGYTLDTPENRSGASSDQWTQKTKAWG